MPTSVSQRKRRSERLGKGDSGLGTDTTIRPMHAEDADAVRALDVQAFGPYYRRFAGGRAVPCRTRENVLACLALNPAGCFVAGAGEELVGFIFSRRWGAVGWAGVFGVHPEKQGQGIGRQLLHRAVAQLEAAGCRVIGLETMPDSTYNVGLYARAGFHPAHPTVVLTKEIEAPVQQPSFALLSRLPTQAGLAIVTEISESAQPGLDCAVEAWNALEHGWGETLLIGQPEPWGAAIVRTRPKREGDVKAVAEVAALVIRAGARERLAEALQAVGSYARQWDLATLRLPVYSADWATLEALLALGFRVWHLGLRLLVRGEYGCPAGVDLSRWAM